MAKCPHCNKTFATRAQEIRFDPQKIKTNWVMVVCTECDKLLGFVEKAR